MPSNKFDDCASLQNNARDTQEYNHEQLDAMLLSGAGEERKHSKLIRSILKPDNPFAKMTDKDMLLFNPNYSGFLQKLKSKDSKSSELSKIMTQLNSKKLKKKKKAPELALYAHVRQAGIKVNKAPASAEHGGHIKVGHSMIGRRDTSQNMSSHMNADVMV